MTKGWAVEDTRGVVCVMRVNRCIGGRKECSVCRWAEGV